MADIIYPDKLKELGIAEHDGGATPTKKVLLYGWDASGLQKVRLKVDANGQVYVVHSITTISDGRKIVTTAGTRVALATSTVCKKVDITAETDNTGIIVVGGSTVVAALATRQGIPLYAGDTYSFEIDNLADVYLDSTVSGDGCTFTYYN